MKPTLGSICLLIACAATLTAAATSHELPDDGDLTATDPGTAVAAPLPASTPAETPVPDADQGSSYYAQAWAAPQDDGGTPAGASKATPRGFRHTPPKEAMSGVILTLDIFSPQPIQGGGAMARRVGDAEFKPFPLNKLEDNYYTVDLPAAFVNAPGIEYYLYVVTNGRREIVWASPVDPVRVSVEGGINAGPGLERYRYSHALNGFGETYSYPAAGGKQANQVTEYEVEYVHRFFGPVYSVHYGQGLYQARESTSLSPTAGLYTQQNGFFYSFLEVDLSPPDSKLILALKGMGGALEGQTGAGYEARLIYGDDLGMNVSAGVRGIQNMGQAVNLNMRVRPLAWLSLGLGGEVGDMPDGATLGFREYVDAMFQLYPQVKLLLRGGSAAYNIEQIGGDFGAGLTYEF